MNAIALLITGLIATGPSTAGWQPVLGLETDAPVYPEVSPVLPDIRPGKLGVFGGIQHPWGRGVLGYDPEKGAWISLRIMRPEGGLRPFVGLDRTWLADFVGEGTRAVQAPWTWKIPLYAGIRVQPHPRWAFSLGAGRGDYALELQQRPVALQPVGGFAALHLRLGPAWITFEAREPSQERTLWIRWHPGGSPDTRVTVRARYLDYTPEAVTVDHIRIQLERVLPVARTSTLPPQLQALMDPFNPVVMGWEVVPPEQLQRMQKKRYIEISPFPVRNQERLHPLRSQQEGVQVQAGMPSRRTPKDAAEILLEMARADLRAGWVARARMLMRMARHLARQTAETTDLLARP